MPERISPNAPYLDLGMPECFRLDVQTDTGEWLEEAFCWRRDFERLPDGSYVFADQSSRLILRCVADRGDHFLHMDGGGNLFYYRLVPMPQPSGAD